MLKILIADDHAVVRRGLKQILELELDPVTVGEARDAADLLGKIPTEKWDLVVLDLSMPGSNGLDLLKDLKRRHPGLPVLVLSMHPEDQFAVRVIKAGAGGYLTKEASPEDLSRAVRKVISGGKFVSETLAQKMLFDLNADPDKAPHESLSDREFQVLRLMASGRSPKQMAEELHLSIKTISTYRARILEKLRLQTNAELIQYAIRNGMAP